MSTISKEHAPRGAHVLTDSQIACLKDGVRLPYVDPFDYGSTTIAVLKREGLIEPIPPLPPQSRRVYRVTNAGREALRVGFARKGG